MYNVSSQKAARSLTSRWSSSSTVTYSVACVTQSTDTLSQTCKSTDSHTQTPRHSRCTHSVYKIINPAISGGIKQRFSVRCNLFDGHHTCMWILLVSTSNNLRFLSHNVQNNQSVFCHVSRAGFSSDCKARCLRRCWDVKGRKNWRLMGKWDLLNHATPGCNKQQHSCLTCMWACSTVTGAKKTCTFTTIWTINLLDEPLWAMCTVFLGLYDSNLIQHTYLRLYNKCQYESFMSNYKCIPVSHIQYIQHIYTYETLRVVAGSLSLNLLRS